MHFCGGAAQRRLHSPPPTVGGGTLRRGCGPQRRRRKARTEAAKAAQEPATQSPSVRRTPISRSSSHHHLHYLAPQGGRAREVPPVGHHFSGQLGETLSANGSSERGSGAPRRAPPRPGPWCGEGGGAAHPALGKRPPGRAVAGRGVRGRELREIQRRTGNSFALAQDTTSAHSFNGEHGAAPKKRRPPTQSGDLGGHSITPGGFPVIFPDATRFPRALPTPARPPGPPDPRQAPGTPADRPLPPPRGHRDREVPRDPAKAPHIVIFVEPGQESVANLGRRSLHGVLLRARWSGPRALGVRAGVLLGAPPTDRPLAREAAPRLKERRVAQQKRGEERPPPPPPPSPALQRQNPAKKQRTDEQRGEGEDFSGAHAEGKRESARSDVTITKDRGAKFKRREMDATGGGIFIFQVFQAIPPEDWGAPPAIISSLMNRRL